MQVGKKYVYMYIQYILCTVYIINNDQQHSVYSMYKSSVSVDCEQYKTCKRINIEWVKC